jgi:2-keto-4-pentenoate hydratase/2-oxohepta-3-ene-1,7-dioic acid hydratase in catechol pathway
MITPTKPFFQTQEPWMKLVRFGPAGREKPGLIDAQGRLRDLSGVITDVSPDQLHDKALAKLARLKTDQLPLVRGKPRMGCPVSQVGKFIAIGLNYADHAAESNLPVPAEPVVFMKATSCIQGPNDNVMLPKGSLKSDWEVELGVVIGTRASYVSQAQALQHVAGYCVVNDVSERAFQLERGMTWDKGKGCDTFGPIGPWLVTRDEVPNPQRLGLWLDLNGERVQTGNTKTMVFNVAKLVSYVSQFMTLCPGDVITTGTPPGVGMGRKNKKGQPDPLFLKPGDVMTLGVEGLGEQRQQVVAYKKH